ncbi:MAG: hypothetical protein ACLPXB_10085, partial [Thiobacillaceae bacterium]
RAFRSAVLGELGSIYPIPANWPHDIDAFLRAAFPGIQRAFNNFKPFVPRWHRHAFDRAWSIYRLDPDAREIDQQCYHHYMEFASNSDPRGTFKKNVDGLLSFANKT